ncbi:hypothetical protein GN958_ATG09315 [Phytophthora infestans]|uniref:Uncharacterized protein n=1 Tax=Phytophthora infestans TaxID=4787 RepID=A0A8S9UPR7_PHYIN|nr:hypothetical protein GN958_ATG09315 [Phytophthora infestans]
MQERPMFCTGPCRGVDHSTAGPDDDDGARQKWHVACQKITAYGDVGLCEAAHGAGASSLEDVQMKTVALKCSACLRSTGDPVRQVLRGGLGRSQRNLRKGEQVALLSGEQKNQLSREQVNLHRGEQVALLGGE